MTFNDVCYNMEEAIESIITDSNDILSDMYVVESAFNLGVVLEADSGKSGSFLTALKEKIKWLGEKISDVFNSIGKFFVKIFNNATGRNKLAYNKSLVSRQCLFIEKAIKYADDTRDEERNIFEEDDSLFVSTEALATRRGKVSGSGKRANRRGSGEVSTSSRRSGKHYRAEADRVEMEKNMPEEYKKVGNNARLGKRHQEKIFAENSNEASYELAKSLCEKFKVGVDPKSITLLSNMKADMSIADASTQYKAAFSKIKKEIINNYNQLKKDAANGDAKDAAVKGKKSFKKTLKTLNAAGIIVKFMRTSKISSNQN